MKNWKERLSGPEEVLKPRTLVEVYGMDRLLVEHHRGISSYGSERIVICATFGTMTVEGTGLRLCCMSRSQLVIRGQLRGFWMEAG